MRFLVRMLPRAIDRPAFLSTVRSLARSTMAEARNPKWASYGALELDVFTRTAGDFALFLATVEPLAQIEFSRDLNQAPPHRTKQELVEEARRYFNSERFWEAHEALETAWRSSDGDEKLYLQGLILVCAAFVHHQKTEEGVAVGILRRAAKQLAFSSDSCHGIDTASMKRHVDDILRTGKIRVFRA